MHFNGTLVGSQAEFFPLRNEYPSIYPRSRVFARVSRTSIVQAQKNNGRRFVQPA